MATQKVTLKYTGSVKPAKTTFLTPGDIPMDFETDIDLEDSDIANAKKVQSEFQAAMDSQLKGQAGYLSTWLADKDKAIQAMVTQVQALAGSIPSSQADAKKYADAMQTHQAAAQQLKGLEAEYTTIVNDWAKNAREQQGLIAARLAVKNARVKTFNDKTVRVRLGQAIKVTLVIAAIAIGVAGVVLSAGTLTPVFLGLAAAGAALAGITSLATAGKSIYDNLTVEKKLMANVAADVTAVKSAYDAASVSKGKIGKHVTELRNLMNIRNDQIKALKADVQKCGAPVQAYSAELAKLKSNKTVDAGAVAKRQKAIDDVSKEVSALQAKLTRLEADNAKAKTLLDSLQSMVGDLDKLSQTTPNTVLGNLKERITSFDGVADIANTGAGFLSGISALGPSPG